MDRVIQSSFPGMNLWSPVRGSSRINNYQNAFRTRNSPQGYIFQRFMRNQKGVVHPCLLGNEPKLFSLHLQSLRIMKHERRSSLVRCGIRNPPENFAENIDGTSEADSLSRHSICIDSMLRECTIDTTSLHIEDGQKHAYYIKLKKAFLKAVLIQYFDCSLKLNSWIGCQMTTVMTRMGAVVLFLALTAISIHPALAVSTISGTKAAARVGSSAVVALGGKATRSLLRTELISSAWTGLVAGCLHTLTGPDHLAALAPLSIGRTRMESAAVGALWGCGHDAGQVIFGIIFLLLKDKLHIELLRTWGARVVGMTLLVIGAMGIKEASDIPAPCVALDGGDCQVSIMESAETMRSDKKNLGFATFATGIVHGLQPDALLMILPALALPSRLAGAAFLCMFLLGTVMAMGSYTAFIGSCSNALKKRIPRITEGLSWGSSLIAIAFGVAVLMSEIFGINLF
eukprot:Gb_01255 [translate_table: standard]